LGGGKDRARRKARERYERQRQARLERQRKIRRRGGIGLVVLVIIGLVAGGIALFNGNPTKSQAAAPKPSTSPSASASPTAPAVAEPARHCTYTKQGTAARTVSLPPATPDYKATYTATIHTNRGNIVINLLNSKATCTVNSFVHLADAGFWDQSQCHRLSTSGGLYMLQCGDPYAKATANLTCNSSSKIGTGGPGYGFASENLTGATYPAGTVAMANSGTPDSNGSQFFLVFNNTSLPAQYTPFGTISSGLDILQNVAKAGTSCTYAGAGGGAPKDKVIIDSVTVKQT
jgi:peptidyl-prolyl cis-trans isomerase B (cyclophilin B)